MPRSEPASAADGRVKPDPVDGGGFAVARHASPLVTPAQAGVQRAARDELAAGVPKYGALDPGLRRDDDK